MRKIELTFDNENIAEFKKCILINLSAQLSDGEWENTTDFYEELWNWLEFTNKKNKVIITVKNRPTWKGTKDIFSKMSDQEVIKYIAEVLEDCYDECPSAFRYNDEEIEVFLEELAKYY